MAHVTDMLGRLMGMMLRLLAGRRELLRTLAEGPSVGPWLTPTGRPGAGRPGWRYRRQMWAAVRKARLQDKWLARIGREGFAHRVHLPLHVWHWPRRHTLFQQAHVSCEILAGVRVKVRVRRRDGHLGSPAACQHMSCPR